MVMLDGPNLAERDFGPAADMLYERAPLIAALIEEARRARPNEAIAIELEIGSSVEGKVWRRWIEKCRVMGIDASVRPRLPMGLSLVDISGDDGCGLCNSIVLVTDKGATDKGASLAWLRARQAQEAYQDGDTEARDARLDEWDNAREPYESYDAQECREMMDEHTNESGVDDDLDPHEVWAQEFESRSLGLLALEEYRRAVLEIDATPGHPHARARARLVSAISRLEALGAVAR